MTTSLAMPDRFHALLQDPSNGTGRPALEIALVSLSEDDCIGIVRKRRAGTEDF